MEITMFALRQHVPYALSSLDRICYGRLDARFGEFSFGKRSESFGSLLLKVTLHYRRETGHPLAGGGVWTLAFRPARHRGPNKKTRCMLVGRKRCSRLRSGMRGPEAPSELC